MLSNFTALETVTEMKAAHQARTEDEILGPATVLIYTILRAIQGILAITGNTITIAVVYKYEFLREISNSRMVAGLALADIFGGLNPFCGPIARTLISDPAILTPMCYLQMICALLSEYGNCYLILLLTLDRLIFIIQPMHYVSVVTARRALAATCLAWGLAIMQISLMMAFSEISNVEISCRWSEAIPFTAVSIIVGQYVVISYCVIVPIYVLIGYISWKATKNEPDICHFAPEIKGQQRKKISERKMAKTIGLVLGTYLISFSPVLFFRALALNMDKLSFSVVLGNRIAHVIYTLQSLLNPFIYGWKHPQFKRAYKKLLRRQHQVSPIEHYELK